jgi:hypothetical protein
VVDTAQFHDAMQHGIREYATLRAAVSDATAATSSGILAWQQRQQAQLFRSSPLTFLFPLIPPADLFGSAGLQARSAAMLFDPGGLFLHPLEAASVAR